jgi:protein-tyrosine phosphatase
LAHTAGRAERDIRDMALADQRHIPVPGTYNVRDVGGYPSAGGTVPWRTLFRSDGLHRLDRDGVAALAGLNLRTIVDLRADVEVQQQPSAIAGLPARAVRTPMVRDLEVLPPADLAEIYRYMIDQCGDSIGAAVRELCAPAALPAMVHCSAGKDRTGIVIALVLALLGVPDELIGADYALSAVYLAPDSTAAIGRLKAAGLRDELTTALLASPSALILDVLAWARAAGGGSVDGYLAAHGVSAAELAALRSALTS